MGPAGAILLAYLFLFVYAAILMIIGMACGYFRHRKHKKPLLVSLFLGAFSGFVFAMFSVSVLFVVFFSGE